MGRLEGEHTRLRIYIGEDDRHGSEPLYSAVVHMLRAEGIAGASVIRGVMGFGANSVMKTASILRLSQGLPLIIEVVDTRAHIDHVLPVLDEMINEGMVTLERVGVLRYAPKERPGE